jgi:uncharacterized membrane protein YkvA (DUF1232 family)
MKKKAPLTFEQASLKAASYVRRREKLSRLLEVATRKSERYYESLLAPWESLQIFIRMIRAWAAGKYCAPAASVLMVVAAVIYFVSAFDLIPDAIPVFGLTDDAAVITCVAKANLTAISNFRKWEILFSGDFPFPRHWVSNAEKSSHNGRVVITVGGRFRSGAAIPLRFQNQSLKPGPVATLRKFVQLEIDAAPKPVGPPIGFSRSIGTALFGFKTAMGAI